MVIQELSIPTVPASECRVTYTVNSSGEVEICEELMPGEGLPEIPEVGMLLVLDGSFQNLCWFGRGPHESYWDRQESAKVGIHSGRVIDQLVPYIRPQECGNKTEVRWLEITDDNGTGILISGKPTVEACVLPYTPTELEEYDHFYKLPDSGRVVVRVNYRQMGVGGDNSWGARTHPEFTLPADRKYVYAYTLKGIGHKNILR
jgi:beta-galactosidase